MIHEDIDVDDKKAVSLSNGGFRFSDNETNKNVSYMQEPTLCARWLQWRKTREEIFGVETEAWCESWALQFILYDTAHVRQMYLWQYLCLSLIHI